MMADPTSSTDLRPFADRVRRGVGLAPFTTLELGGEASQFVRVFSESDLIAALAYAREEGLATFILGGGSNVLISDGGFDGLVIKMSITGRSFEQTDGNIVIATVAAGEVWDEFVADCVTRNLSGIECMSGIPGLVGGTPIQNVGAYGQDVSETIRSVRCLDTSTDEIVTLGNVDCGFDYRKSIFNTTELGRYVVTAVEFALELGGTPKLEYRDVKARFSGHQPTLGEVRDTILEIRSQKSMIIQPDDPNRRSAGSFFKNPVVSHDKFAELARRFPDIPSFPAQDGVKVPAAWLIEAAGFEKGFRRGNVGISSKHSLALINLGDAKTSEVVELRELIRDAIDQKFGIRIHQEPVQIGFTD